MLRKLFKSLYNWWFGIKKTTKPSGTTSILSDYSGIEPVFSNTYKRRYRYFTEPNEEKL